MRVLCISKVMEPDPISGALPIVKEGSVYHVYEVVSGNVIGPAYELVEHMGYVYAQHLFIPIKRHK